MKAAASKSGSMQTGNGTKPWRANLTIGVAAGLICNALWTAMASAQLPPRAVETFRVPSSYPGSLAFDGANIWVTSSNSAYVSKLRASDGALLGNFPVPTTNYSATFDGTYVWISNRTFPGITRLRPDDGSVEGTYLTGQVAAYRMLFDGENVWANTAASVVKLRASDVTILGTYPVQALFGLAFDGSNIWATSYYFNSVTKIRANDGTILGSYPVGSYPVGVAFDGSSIWVASPTDNTLTQLRASDGAFLHTVPVGHAPCDVVFDGHHIWTVNADDKTAMRINPKNGAIQRAYSTGPVPQFLLFDGTNIWVSDFLDHGLVNKILPRK